VQQEARHRILRTFVTRKLIDANDAKDMASTAHGGGFSVDASVCIDAHDRAGLERLLRYCATARGRLLRWNDYTSAERMSSITVPNHNQVASSMTYY